MLDEDESPCRRTLKTGLRRALGRGCWHHLKQFELKRAMKPGWSKVLLLIAATAAVWWSLGRLDRGVKWLTVEAPSQAVAGELLPMRVRATGLKEASNLCVDLHWSSTRDTSNGYLASGGVKPVGTKGGSFDFEIMVRATQGLRFVNGIIFLSTTGNWSNHTFVAATDLIPVASNRKSGAPTFVRLPIHELVESPGPDRARASNVPRVLTGLLLLAASAVAWMVLRSIPKRTEAASWGSRWWVAVTVTLSLACIWELFGLERWVGSEARTLARAEDVYYPRAWFQKGVISITVAATLVFLGVVWRKRTSYQALFLFLGLYLALSIVNLLSFHSIDEYTGLSWHGVTLIEAMKCVCAAATLRGVLQARQ